MVAERPVADVEQEQLVAVGQLCREEITHVQGKEQRLCFAGVAVKRYPHIQGKRNLSKDSRH